MKDVTEQRYNAALAHLHSDRALGDRWVTLDDRQKDSLVADWMVEAFEADESRAEYGIVLSALSRVEPQVSFKLSWKVFNIWSQKQPSVQAPAYPPEVIEAIAAACFIVNRPLIGVVVMTCFSGLLRVSEALNLTWADVYITGTCVVLCLGTAKRGTEQKVLLSHPVMQAWFTQLRAFCKPKSEAVRVFAVSYGTVLRWLAKISSWLMLPVKVTTHTFRRSGASQLARLNMPMFDLLAFGRWATQASATLYIRKGETAIARYQNERDAGRSLLISSLAALCAVAWAIPPIFVSADVDLPSTHRVDSTVFEALFKVFSKLFRV